MGKTQKEKVKLALTETQKLNEDIKKTNLRMDIWAKKLRLLKSSIITLIGFFGALITLFIDNIRQGAIDLPTTIGWLQLCGFVICVLIFFWGVILLGRKK